MSALCTYCHQRPVHPGFPYCGKTCGVNAKSITQASLAQTSNLCDVCQNRPKYTDPTTGQLHSFCGRACASQAKAKLASTPNARASVPTPQASSIASGTCQIAGCGQPVLPGSSFCSTKHKDLGKTVCLWCHQKGQYKESAYCGKNCMNTAEAQAPNLLAVPKDHNIYRSVVDQFEESWRHNTQKPKVHEVFKVVLSTTSRQAYEQYRASVETQRGLPMGNQCRRWHGSQRDCDIGEQSTNTSLCNSNKCGICGIIRTSYKVSKAQRNISFGRFGAGIYTTSTSSKADSYAKNTNNSTTKAIFLNHVVVGKGSKYMLDRINLTGPPSGYDSVLGEVGLVLNHDECIVYRDDAIRPAYLVVYDE